MRLGVNLGPFFMSTNLSSGGRRRRSGPSPLTKGAGKAFVWTLAFPFVAMYYVCVWPFMKMFGVAADQYGATARGEAQPTWNDFRARHPRAALATIVLGGLFALALLIKLWFIWIPLVVIAGIAMLVGKRRMEHNERVQGLSDRADDAMRNEGSGFPPPTPQGAPAAAPGWYGTPPRWWDGQRWHEPSAPPA